MKKKVLKGSPAPASTKPDAALVKSITADVAAQLADAHAAQTGENVPGVSTGESLHVYGAVGAGKFDWGKLAGKIVGPALEVAGFLKDGKLDAGEAAQVGKMVFDLVLSMMSQAATPAPDAPKAA